MFSKMTDGNVSGESLQTRLDALSAAEVNLGKALSAASQYLNDMSGDKPPAQKNIQAVGDQYRSNIQQVEKELVKQIDYLSNVTVGSSHEGSVFIPVHKTAMGEERLRYLKNSLSEYQQQHFPSTGSAM